MLNHRQVLHRLLDEGLGRFLAFSLTYHPKRFTSSSFVPELNCRLSQFSRQIPKARGLGCILDTTPLPPVHGRLEIEALVWEGLHKYDKLQGHKLVPPHHLRWWAGLGEFGKVHGSPVQGIPSREYESKVPAECEPPSLPWWRILTSAPTARWDLR